MKTEPKPLHGSPEWLRARQRNSEGLFRFGASEAPTLMGVNPFGNLVDLFIEKHDPDPISIRSKAFHRGNVLEPALVGEAGREYGFEPVVPEVMFTNGRLIANLDGADDALNPTRIIEAKTSTWYDTNDDLPEPYYWQAVAQLATTEADSVIVVCLDRRQTIGFWTVERDEHDLSIHHLLDRATEIGELFDASKLPDEIQPTQEQINRLYPDPSGDIHLDDDQVQIVRDWQAAKEELKKYEQREEELRNIVASMIGEHEYAMYDGMPVLSYKSRKIGRRFDATRFREQQPELYEAYLKDGGTTRVLRTMKGK